MKKLLAIEFFWFIVALIVAFPMGLLILRLSGETSYGAMERQGEQEFVVELYLLSVLVAFIGVYIMRFVVIGIGFLVKANE